MAHGAEDRTTRPLRVMRQFDCGLWLMGGVPTDGRHGLGRKAGFGLETSTRLLITADVASVHHGWLAGLGVDERPLIGFILARLGKYAFLVTLDRAPWNSRVLGDFAVGLAGPLRIQKHRLENVRHIIAGSTQAVFRALAPNEYHWASRWVPWWTWAKMYSQSIRLVRPVAVETVGQPVRRAVEEHDHRRQIGAAPVEVGVLVDDRLIDGHTRLRATVDADLVELECLFFSCHGWFRFLFLSTRRRKAGSDAGASRRFESRLCRPLTGSHRATTSRSIWPSSSKTPAWASESWVHLRRLSRSRRRRSGGKASIARAMRPPAGGLRMPRPPPGARSPQIALRYSRPSRLISVRGPTWR